MKNWKTFGGNKRPKEAGGGDGEHTLQTELGQTQKFQKTKRQKRFLLNEKETALKKAVEKERVRGG